jgi:hypothetical protein
MTDADKILKYDRVVQFIEDQMALETHLRLTGRDRDEVLFTHQDAYEHIVDVVKGLGKLRSLNSIHCDRQAPNPVGT